MVTMPPVAKAGAAVGGRRGGNSTPGGRQYPTQVLHFAGGAQQQYNRLQQVRLYSYALRGSLTFSDSHVGTTQQPSTPRKGVERACVVAHTPPRKRKSVVVHTWGDRRCGRPG